MNDIDPGPASASSTDFSPTERPTSPRSAGITSTSRWRTVATAALAHGFGRLSEGEFDEGRAPDPTEPSPIERVKTDPPVDDFVAVGAPVDAPPKTCVLVADPAVVSLPVEASVEVKPLPRRDLGPRGTVRIIAREDRGPTGTVRIRARASANRPKPATRQRVLTVSFVGALCAILAAASYGRDEPPPTTMQATAVAIEARPAPDPVTAPAVVAGAVADEPVLEPSPADPPPVAAGPTKHGAPRGPASRKHVTKANVL
jgi:hypothetical protein